VQVLSEVVDGSPALRNRLALGRSGSRVNAHLLLLREVGDQLLEAGFGVVIIQSGCWVASFEDDRR